jgi:uncharacterized protein YjiS (DUF1127 family)
MAAVSDKKSADSTPAMWPVQQLAGRIIGTIHECTVDTTAAMRSWSRQADLERALNALADDNLADLGITREQIPALAGAEGAPELLRRMLQRLGLPAQSLAEFAELQSQVVHECAICFARAACKRWLRRGQPADGYKSFCPNAATFDQLIKDAFQLATATETR